ncbi:MAG: SDR family NAD(P)-dependent oxidoreductase [Mycobacteriales bacterium]
MVTVSSTTPAPSRSSGETPRRVLVTGASRGAGRAIARAFAELGDRVVVHHRDSARDAERVVAALPGAGHCAVGADLRYPTSTRCMVNAAAAALGGLDVVVNNAALQLESPILGTAYDQWLEAWRHTIEVNLLGAANVAWCASRLLPRGGRIVKVSSRGAYRGEPEAPAYGASKAGLISLSGSLARALAPRGIAVASVAPGFIEPDESNVDKKSPRGPELPAQSPWGRVATAPEVAAAVVYLASPLAEFATGTVIDVNGASYLR